MLQVLGCQVVGAGGHGLGPEGTACEEGGHSPGPESVRVRAHMPVCVYECV